MKSSDKKAIVICAIAIITIIALLTIKSNNPKETKQKTNQNKSEVQTEEFVEMQADGTKLNTSSKLKETKTIDGLEITNIQLT